MDYTENLARYDCFVDQCDRFQRKGKTMPYTSSNGHMFSLLNKDGELGIRFSKEKQESYFIKFDTGFYKSYNATMRGYILITEQMLTSDEVIIALLNESFDFVNTLAPK
jgi:hypothetical protein